MEGGKGESQKRGCKGVLLVFCVFTLVLALLEGAGLVYVYSNFHTRITALEKGPKVVTLTENPSEGNCPLSLLSPIGQYPYPACRYHFVVHTMCIVCPLPIYHIDSPLPRLLYNPSAVKCGVSGKCCVCL